MMPVLRWFQLRSNGVICRTSLVKSKNRMTDFQRLRRNVLREIHDHSAPHRMLVFSAAVGKPFFLAPILIFRRSSETVGFRNVGTLPEDFFETFPPSSDRAVNFCCLGPGPSRRRRCIARSR